MPVIEASDHSYLLAESDREVDVPEEIPNAMAAGGDGAVSIVTGTDMGPVDVAVQVLNSAPVVDVDAWDEVVEVSVTTAEELHLLAWDFSPPEDDVPPLATTPGSYRVRVHARGRDRAHAAGPVVEEALEQHLIQIWPAAVGAEQVLKASDEFGDLMGRRP